MQAPSSLKGKQQNLRVLQKNIINAIETNNLALFIDLGGHDSVDLNFFAQYDSTYSVHKAPNRQDEGNA